MDSSKVSRDAFHSLIELFFEMVSPESTGETIAYAPQQFFSSKRADQVSRLTFNETMKRISKFLASASLLLLSAPASALDGLIGPSVFYVFHASEVERGSSTMYKFEFTRLSRYFGLDVRAGTGKGYTDLGGSLRLLRHFSFNDQSATGVTVGGGAGAMWADMPSPVPGKDNALIDVVGHAFARFMWDFNGRVGLGAEFEYQVVPYRSFQTGPPSHDQTLRHRVLFGINLLFDPGV